MEPGTQRPHHPRSPSCSEIPRRLHRSHFAASNSRKSPSVRGMASMSSEGRFAAKDHGRYRAANDFSAKSRPILLRCREWRPLNSKLSASRKPQAPRAQFDIDIRYDLVGTRKDMAREQRVGHWLTRWAHDEARGWRALRWQATEETRRSRPRSQCSLTLLPRL